MSHVDAITSTLLGKPLVKSPVWELWNDDGHYADYGHWIPDSNGYGARLRITLDLEDSTAYMTLVVDNEYGDTFVEQGSISIPWDVAVSMTNHTFTGFPTD
jgi:hypothetical protein